MKKTANKYPTEVEKRLEKFEHKHGYRPQVFTVNKDGKPVAYFRGASLENADDYYSALNKKQTLWRASKILLERCFLDGQEIFRKPKNVRGLSDLALKILEGKPFETRIADGAEMMAIGDDLDAKRFNPDESELIVFEDKEAGKKAFFYEATLKESDLALSEYSKSGKPLNHAKMLAMWCFASGDKDFFENPEYILGGLREAVEALETSEEFDLGNG